MIKNKTKFIVLITFILILIFSQSYTVRATSYDYTIDDYQIDMIVNENNTFDITETITANFNVSKHGIFRKIPLRNKIVRNDGSKSTNRAKISNISVNDNYTTYKENGYEVIKIGSDKQTYTGEITYTIKYTYDIGNDPLKNADELYFNLIGSEWDTSISNVSFKITMPKKFDKSLLGFSSGNKGSTNSSNVSYSVDGNIISGYLKNTLSEGQALTIRLTLPEGYFVKTNSNIDNIYKKFTIMFSIMCVIISYILWEKYGKDDKVIESVEFYPPNGFNSAEAGFLYKGIPDDDSIISLLIYLANKGYLKIEESEDGFKILKIKEYNGNNVYEKMFFEGLFRCSNYDEHADVAKAQRIMKEAKKNGEEITFNDAMSRAMKSNIRSYPYVTKKDLYNKFYTTIRKIKDEFNLKENKDKIFEPSASKKIKWLIMMIISIFVLITVKPMLDYGYEHVFVALFFSGIGFSVLLGSLIGTIRMPRIFGFIWGVGFGGAPWLLYVFPALLQDTMYLKIYAIGIICVAIILVFMKILPKRTPYGNEIFEKLKGFKRFLKTAEKPQLESLVLQNPEYFYNILPYTYALGVSDVWINQFEIIAIKAPDWYDSTNTFNMHSFGSFMTKTMDSAHSSMTSGSSSGSGGGSSGGGSGGGGGGSW